MAIGNKVKYYQNKLKDLDMASNKKSTKVYKPKKWKSPTRYSKVKDFKGRWQDRSHNDRYAENIWQQKALLNLTKFAKKSGFGKFKDTTKEKNYGTTWRERSHTDRRIENRFQQSLIKDLENWARKAYKDVGYKKTSTKSNDTRWRDRSHTDRIIENKWQQKAITNLQSWLKKVEKHRSPILKAKKKAWDKKEQAKFQKSIQPVPIVDKPVVSGSSESSASSPQGFTATMAEMQAAWDKEMSAAQAAWDKEMDTKLSSQQNVYDTRISDLQSAWDSTHSSLTDRITSTTNQLDSATNQLKAQQEQAAINAERARVEASYGRSGPLNQSVQGVRTPKLFNKFKKSTSGHFGRSGGRISNSSLNIA